MKKRLAILWVIAALFALAACSAQLPASDTEQTQEQEQIVLRFFHYQGEAEEAYSHVIAAYEKAHPNVKIKSEFLNSENYNSTLDARIAVQDCPDIIGVHPGYAQVLPLARALREERALVQVAKSAPDAEIALAALERLNEPRALGAVWFEAFRRAAGRSTARPLPHWAHGPSTRSA